MIRNDWGWRYLGTLAWVYAFGAIFTARESYEAWIALMGSVVFFTTTIKVWLVPLGEPLTSVKEVQPPRMWNNWIGYKFPSYRIFRFSPTGDHWVEGFTYLDNEWQFTAIHSRRGTTARED